MKSNYENPIHNSIYLGCLHFLCSHLERGNNRGKTLNFDHDTTYCEMSKVYTEFNTIIFQGFNFVVECNICRGQLKSQNIPGLF